MTFQHLIDFVKQNSLEEAEVISIDIDDIYLTGEIVCSINKCSKPNKAGLPRKIYDVKRFKVKTDICECINREEYHVDSIFG